jgi:hypothetical protein
MNTDNNEIITIEQYLKSIETIRKYHKQINNEIDGYLTDGKTPIRSWDKLSKCSTRLQGILLGRYRHDKLMYRAGLDKYITHIEDIDRDTFMKQPRAGKKSWEEFLKLINS